MTFTFKKRDYVDVSIDFQKIHDYICEEFKDSEFEVDIVEIFGDNVEYYLEKTHNIVIIFDDDDSILKGILFNDNEEILDDIFLKFQKWYYNCSINL